MTNIHTIRAILSAGTKRIRENRGVDGYAYASGWLESTLADAIDQLAEFDPVAAERLLSRAEKVK